MKKIIKREIPLVILFVIVTLIYITFNRSHSLLIISAGIISIVVTGLLEIVLYKRRSMVIFSFAAAVLGYYAGILIYKTVYSIAPQLFILDLTPFFSLIAAYLGFSLTIQSEPKCTQALSRTLNIEADKKNQEVKILDTSVVIDGRISDIVETKFVSGALLVPKFVLNEIQALADSKDPIKRSRARRGLDVLNKMKEIDGINLKIYSRDYPDIKGVDAKLIALAKELGGSIVTNDYNLNKVAKLDGIIILNINDLSNALKPVLLPGEEMTLDVLKEGKENGQGIGYLSDGTMVVVSNGIKYIGKNIQVKVTSILQTSAGRIIFTEPKK